MPSRTVKRKTTKASVKKNKSTKASATKSVTSVAIKDNFRQSISERLKLDESYASLILGALVVVFLMIFLMAALGGRKAVTEMKIKNSPPPTPVAKNPAQKTYVLQDGEGLWDAAVKFYGDGFKWVLISQANHIDNPDNVEPGTKLIIP